MTLTSEKSNIFDSHFLSKAASVLKLLSSRPSLGSRPGASGTIPSSAVLLADPLPALHVPPLRLSPARWQLIEGSSAPGGLLTVAAWTTLPATHSKAHANC